MVKKHLLFFLSLVLFLSSCGFENEYSGDEVTSRPSLNTVSEEENETPDSTNVLSGIEGYDYGGKSFVIVTTDGEYFETEEGKSLIGKAVSDRNGVVETKFNINIEIRVSTDDEIVKECTSAVSNGKHYADLIVAPANTLSRLMEENCLKNIKTLPFMDWNANYINENLAKASEINGKLYMLFGALTQTEFSSWCVFYNDEISEKIGTDPYSLYKEGKWTWDEFLKYTSAASEYTKSGFVSAVGEDDLINAFWATTGNKFFGECSNTALSLPKAENGKEILSSIKEIVKSDSFGKESGTSALEAFTSGKSAVLLCRRNAVYQMCESGMKWSAVPMPKYNEESSHYSYVDGEALAAAVPGGNIDSDYVGRILNALVVSTEKTVNESIKINELYYYWENNEMALQMEDVKKNLHLDIGIIYAYAVKDIAMVTTENIKTAFDAGIAPFQFYHSTKNQFNLYASEHFG